METAKKLWWFWMTSGGGTIEGGLITYSGTQLTTKSGTNLIYY